MISVLCFGDSDLFLLFLTAQLKSIIKEDIMKINRSILIVDDDITLSRLIQRLLERSGHDVSHCDNGFDAVTLSKERDFDMFLIDYNMPELTGDKVCKLIRNQHPDGYIPRNNLLLMPVQTSLLINAIWFKIFLSCPN
jgi:PleD family two-component response regulator